jgi:hypothetical protein
MLKKGLFSHTKRSTVYLGIKNTNNKPWGTIEKNG